MFFLFVIHTVVLLASTLLIQGPVVGIDLGSTYTCVGIYKNGKVQIIPNEQGNRLTPSYVAFSEGQLLVGEAAKNQAAINPAGTAYGFKRLIGRTYDQYSVLKDKDNFTFEVIKQANRLNINLEIKSGIYKAFTLEQISTYVLIKMKQIAEIYLGTEVYDVVLAVPAYFNNDQRLATKEAGINAGLNIVRILNESIAAAMAYGIDEPEKYLLVYYFGGTTFYVSLLDIDQGIYDILGTSEDIHLGGEDWIKESWDIQQNNLRKSQAKLKLLRVIENAKKHLSSALETTIQIKNIIEEYDLNETLTRAKFEDLNIELFKKTIRYIEDQLENLSLSKNDIDEIIIVGGSSKIPKVKQLLKDFFNGKQLHQEIAPDEIIAYGAAVQVGIMAEVDSEQMLMEEWEKYMSDFTPSDLITFNIKSRTEEIFYEDINIVPSLVRGS